MHEIDTILAEYVPRETIDKIHKYVTLLLKWNKKINLVGINEVEKIWHRHILDCLELTILLSKIQINKLVDFGSGSGLPGILIGIICSNISEIHLIESNSKKATFLELASLLCNNKIVIHKQRIELIDNLQADIITARAFADIENTLNYSILHSSSSTKIYTFKGEKLVNEINSAKMKYNFDYKSLKQTFIPNGNIVEINNYRPI